MPSLRLRLRRVSYNHASDAQEWARTVSLWESSWVATFPWEQGLILALLLHVPLCWLLCNLSGADCHYPDLDRWLVLLSFSFFHFYWQTLTCNLLFLPLHGSRRWFLLILMRGCCEEQCAEAVLQWGREQSVVCFCCFRTSSDGHVLQQERFKLDVRSEKPLYKGKDRGVLEQMVSKDGGAYGRPWNQVGQTLSGLVWTVLVLLSYGQRVGICNLSGSSAQRNYFATESLVLGR